MCSCVGHHGGAVRDDHGEEDRRDGHYHVRGGGESER